MKALPAGPAVPPTPRSTPFSPRVPEGGWYLKLEPGAPLPPDLPADAQRYRLMEDLDSRDRILVATGLAVAMVAAGVGLARVGAGGGFAIVSIILALVAVAWGRTPAPPRYVPSATGEYVLAPRSVVAERLGSLAGPPKLSMPVRVLCGAMGAFLLLAMIAVVISTVDAPFLRERTVGLLGFILVAVGFGYLAVKGEVPFLKSVEIPPSPWFHSRGPVAAAAGRRAGLRRAGAGRRLAGTATAMSTDARSGDGQETADAEPGAPPPAHVPFSLAVRRRRDESFGLPAGQVAGFAVLIAALLAALFLFPGQRGLVFGVFMAVIGIGKVVVGQLEAREDDELPPASRAFRELADPTRPLGADDPVSLPRAEAGAAASASSAVPPHATGED
jgi:hypothetical protein